MTNAQSKIILLIIAVSRQTTLDRFWGKDFKVSKIAEIKSKKYNSNEYIELEHERRAFSDYLFRTNPKNDEYYTRAHSWQRFVDDKGLNGATVFEPFYGDGSSTESLIGLVNVVGVKGANFWDIIDDPHYKDMLIMSNPPFSFKWQIIITLLERQRPFALILPWECFFGKIPKGMTDADRLKNNLQKYQDLWGGTYEMFNLKGKEMQFYHPPTDKMEAIGCHILYWTF
jgi:hypothetical protein